MWTSITIGEIMRYGISHQWIDYGSYRVECLHCGISMVEANRTHFHACHAILGEGFVILAGRAADEVRPRGIAGERSRQEMA